MTKMNPFIDRIINWTTSKSKNVIKKIEIEKPTE